MGNWERKNCEWAAKQKGKMVQNVGFVLKNRQVEGRETPEMMAFYPLFNLFLRQNESKERGVS